MSSPLHGRCLCGAIHVELTPPTEPSHCHCESCRRAHAAPVVTWTSVAADRFRVVRGEDQLQRHQSSPGTFRCFCRTCGSSMACYYTADSPTFAYLADEVYVPVAVLTDPLDTPPECHWSFEEHVDWFEFEDDLPRFRAKGDERIGEPAARHVLTILAVEDLDRAAAFYRAAFGWPVRVEAPGYVELELPDGHRLGLYQREGFAGNTGQVPVGVPEGQIAGTELYLHVVDLDQAVRRLVVAGARLLSPVARRDWGDQAAYFADPDGHVLVVARTDR